MRKLWIAVAFVLAVGGSAEARGKGVQLTPDDRQIIVQKDVGSERWSINLDTFEGTITGNVFSDGDRPPVFLWCQPISSTRHSITWDCFAAEPLPDRWRFVDTVTLPVGFFE